MPRDEEDGGHLRRRGLGRDAGWDHQGARDAAGPLVPGKHTLAERLPLAAPSAGAQRVVRGALGAVTQAAARAPELRAAIAARDYLASAQHSFEIRSALRRAEISLADLERRGPREAASLAASIDEARAELAALARDLAELLAAAPVLEAPGAGSAEREAAWHAARRGERTGEAAPSWAAEVTALAPRVGLGAVDVRADDEARRVTEAEDAGGVARGGQVFLHPDRVAPGTAEGRQVLAHELVHVRQSQLAVSGGVSDAREDAEAEADDLGARLANGASVAPRHAIDLATPAADRDAKRSVAHKRAPGRATEVSGPNRSQAESLVARTRLKMPLTVVGQSAEPRPLLVTNTGPVPVVGDVRAEDARGDQVFPVYAAALEPIEPGAAVELRVGFRPDRVGAHHTRLQILDAEGALATSVRVAGHGVSPADAMEVAAERGEPVKVVTYDDVVAALTAAARLADSAVPEERSRARTLARAVDARFDAIEPAIHAASGSYGIASTSFLTTWGYAASEVKLFRRALVGEMRIPPVEYLLRVVEVAEQVIKVGTQEAKRAPHFDDLNFTQALVDAAQYGAGFFLGALKGAAEAIADVVAGGVDMVVTVAKTLFRALIGDWGAIRDMLASWAKKISALIEKRGEIAEDIAKKWNATSDWDRGLYQGEVLGWVMMTVAITALTMGAAAETVLAQAGVRFRAFVAALEQAGRLGDALSWAKGAAKLPAKVARVGAGALGAEGAAGAAAGGAVHAVGEAGAAEVHAASGAEVTAGEAGKVGVADPVAAGTVAQTREGEPPRVNDLSIFAEEQHFSNRFPDHEIGAPIQVIKPSNYRTKTGTFNYVVTLDGELIIGRRDRNAVGGGHIDLAGGRDVLAAGEVKLVSGNVKYINNASGHYLPKGRSARQAAEAAFERAGLSVDGSYVELVYDDAKGKWVSAE